MGAAAPHKKLALVIRKMYIMKVPLATPIIKNESIFGADEIQACAAMHVSSEIKNATFMRKEE